MPPSTPYSPSLNSPNINFNSSFNSNAGSESGMLVLLQRQVAEKTAENNIHNIIISFGQPHSFWIIPLFFFFESEEK